VGDVLDFYSLHRRWRNAHMVEYTEVRSLRLLDNYDIIELFRWGMKRKIVRPVGPANSVNDILNLGSGKSDIPWPAEWARRVVNMDWPEWDANVDGLKMYEDDCIDGIFAFHFLEHLDDPIAMLRECQRVLKVGAPLTIVVPYYSAQIFAHDLTHKHAFCEDTWKVLFNTDYYDKNSMTTVEGAVIAAPWRFSIGTNVIMGIVERNLSLFTQLIKT
jgi:SAM-dependent methyltransferase